MAGEAGRGGMAGMDCGLGGVAGGVTGVPGNGGRAMKGVSFAIGLGAVGLDLAAGDADGGDAGDTGGGEAGADGEVAGVGAECRNDICP